MKYKDNFIKIGLTKSQAEVLSCLIQEGELKASGVAHKIRRPRGVVYKAIEELIESGLIIQKNRANGVKLFQATNPKSIENFFQKKEENLMREKHEFFRILPELTSSFNLSSKQPGVKFFHGEEGIVDILNDSLKSSTDILTICDDSALRLNIGKIDDEYVVDRLEKKIYKKIIAVNSSPKVYLEYQNDKYKSLTEVRFLNLENNVYNMVQIYDNKVSFQTLDQKNKIAVLIEDKNIYNMHKFLFMYIWQTLEKIK